jgi:hypothetical protein
MVTSDDCAPAGKEDEDEDSNTVATVAGTPVDSGKQ